MKKIILASFFGILLIACTPKTTEIITETIEEDAATEEVVEEPGNVTVDYDEALAIEGKKVYTKRCQQCHELKTVTNFTQQQWDRILPNMSRNAGIDEVAESKIAQYIRMELYK